MPERSSTHPCCSQRFECSHEVQRLPALAEVRGAEALSVHVLTGTGTLLENDLDLLGFWDLGDLRSGHVF